MPAMAPTPAAAAAAAAAATEPATLTTTTSTTSSSAGTAATAATAASSEKSTTAAVPELLGSSGIRYRRLDAAQREIRLLELQAAARPTDPVQCRLVTASLDDADAGGLEFLALSSLHGDRAARATITVDGAPVAVTAHLAQALQNVRTVFFPRLEREREQRRREKQQHQQPPSRLARQPTHPPEALGRTSSSGTPRWLRRLLRGVASMLPAPERAAATPLRVWVDALCVDQASAREKEGERAGLAAIYGAARLVIGWLGPAAPTTAAGLAVLHAIDDAMPRRWGDAGDAAAHPDDYAPAHAWARPLAPLWADDPATGAPAFLGDAWQGANDFMYRPYFQQGWILEEMARARYPAFLVGDRLVSWRLVLRINRFMEEFKERDSDLFPPHLRAMIAELPLATVYALLDEFVKRRRLEDAEDLDSTQSSHNTSAKQSLYSQYSYT